MGPLARQSQTNLDPVLKTQINYKVQMASQINRGLAGRVENWIWNVEGRRPAQCTDAQRQRRLERYRLYRKYKHATAVRLSNLHVHEQCAAHWPVR